MRSLGLSSIDWAAVAYSYHTTSQTLNPLAGALERAVFSIGAAAAITLTSLALQACRGLLSGTGTRLMTRMVG